MNWLGDQHGRRINAGVLARCCSWEAVQRKLPFLCWLPNYSLQCLQLDIIAGFTVGLTVVPQALAYAEVAGLPVEFGLYSSFVGCFIYCLLGTAKDVTLGPTAIMSLLVAVYTAGDKSLAILLAFLSGCIQLVMGLFNFGFLLDFISHPVIKAFTSAAAVTIGFSQVKNLLGLKDIPRQFVLQVYETFHKLPSTRLGDAILGFLCIGFLLVLKWMKDNFPRTYRGMPRCYRCSYIIIWMTTTARNAIVVVAAGLVAYSFEVMGLSPFVLTGKTAEGLPRFHLPPFSETAGNRTVPFREMAQNIGAGIIIIPLMGVLESVAIARAFASQNNYRINTNQELLAIGLTNILGSFLSSYPVTGSFGRTALNSQTGVCTPAGGILTGFLVLLSLGYLTPLFYYIPKAALAAVIICAVAPVFDLRICKDLWKVKRIDLLPFLATFLLSFWEIQYGIIIGIVISLIIVCIPVARPQIKVIDTGGLNMMIMSGLSFPAMEYLRDTIHKSAFEGLGELIHEFQCQGLSLSFSGLQPEVLQILLAADLNGFKHLQSMGSGRRSPSLGCCPGRLLRKRGGQYEEGSTEPLLHNAIKTYS